MDTPLRGDTIPKIPNFKQFRGSSHLNPHSCTSQDNKEPVNERTITEKLTPGTDSTDSPTVYLIVSHVRYFVKILKQVSKLIWQEVASPS